MNGAPTQRRGAARQANSSRARSAAPFLMRPAIASATGV